MHIVGRPRAGARTLTAVAIAAATLTTVAVVAALVALGALPAAAHEQLLESRPGDGEALADPPREVVLTFTSDIVPIAPIVLVRDSAGNAVAEGEPAIEGNVVTAALPVDLADGSYLVVWRVVSGDGHPIEGTFPFTVGTVPDDAGSPAAPTGNPDATGPPPASAQAPGTAVPGAVVVGGALATGAAVIALILLLRRRGRSSP